MGAALRRHDFGQLGGRRKPYGPGKIVAVGIPEHAARQPVEKQLRGVDQHQACQDLVGVEPVLEKSRDRTPGGAAGHAKQEHQRQGQPCLETGQQYRHQRAENAAHDELAFGADIPVVGTVAD